MRSIDFSFWLRIRGRGISISTGKALFSERNGYRKAFRIFGVKFEWLPKGNPL